MKKMVTIILFGFGAVLLGCLSQKFKVPVTQNCNTVTKKKYQFFSVVYLAFSFFLLAVPCFLCNEGTDFPIYVYLYKTWTLADLKSLKFEPGFVLLCLILRFIFKNAYIGLGIIKVISLFFVYKSLYMLRNRINLGLSILSYVVLLYIYNYHLLRMALAIGIVFLALAYEVCGRSKVTIALMITSLFIHYTSSIVLLTYLFYIIIGKKIGIAKVTLLSVVLTFLYASIIPLVQNLVLSVAVFEKYTTYLKSATVDIGGVQIVLFIPIAYILIKSYKEGKNDKFYALNVLFGLMLFFSGSLGYAIPVAGRTAYYFFWYAVIFFGATPLVRDKYVYVVNKVRINSTTLVALLYLTLQVVITYFLNDAFLSNGLTQYTLWWDK